MDKTIEIVLVAVVVVFAAAIVMFLVAGESSDFGSFIGDQTDSSQCTLWKSQGECDKASECDWDANECEDDGGATGCAGLSQTPCRSEPGCEWIVTEGGYCRAS